MSVMMPEREEQSSNPMDLVEQVVSANDWAFERNGSDEMAVEIPGRWTGYYLYFSWRSDARMMQLTCAFDMRVPKAGRQSLNGLLALLNEKMCLGHFDLWSDEGLPMFRHAVPLRGVDGLSVEQLEDLVDIAVTECDRFYPAFQFVVWGGKDPSEAVELAILDPLGEA